MIFKMCAVRYSRALYEAAAESGELETVIADMKTVESLFAELPELKAFYGKSELSLAAVKKSIALVFADRVSLKTVNTLNLMVKNDRVMSISFLPAAFLKVSEENGNGYQVTAEFAQQPQESTIAQLRNNMEQRIGKIADLKIREVPSLIGGYRILWANKILDNSVIGRIRQLSQRLLTSRIEWKK